MAPIFQRLGLDQHALESTVVKLFSPGERVPNRLGRAPERLDAGSYRSGKQARGDPMCRRVARLIEPQCELQSVWLIIPCTRVRQAQGTRPGTHIGQFGANGQYLAQPFRQSLLSLFQNCPL